MGKNFSPRRTRMASEQELLPGVPDHITMLHIAPKLNWVTCNALQMVSRGWQRAIHSRSVYDARVLSKNTEPYLILLSVDCDTQMILTLYSCTDRSSLQLPLPPVASFYGVAFLCLEGRIYAWLRLTFYTVTLYVFDLVGNRKWEQRKEVKLPISGYPFDYGVLDGKIYRFVGKTHFHCGVLERRTLHINFHNHWYLRRRVENLPQTEVYDPVRDVWSRITPEPISEGVRRSAVLKRHFAYFFEWTKEQLEKDLSKTSFSNGRYEPYFSEWRRSRPLDCSTTPAIDNDVHNSMANQVYHTHAVAGKHLCVEKLFFFAGELLKLTRDTPDDQTEDDIVDIEIYDTPTNTWQQWKSFSANFLPEHSCCIDEVASVDNSIWAVLKLRYKHTLVKYSLVRSPVLLGEDDKTVKWIGTGYSLGHKRLDLVNLRPIYV